MIKILRDVSGVNQGYALIPFTLENLPEKALKLEAIIVEDDTYTVRPDWVRQVVGAEEKQVIEITKELHENALFVVRVDLQQINATSVYIRIYNEDTSFVSPKIILAKSQEATMTTNAIELDFRPKTVKITDSVDCTANGVLVPFGTSKFNIQVLASNNSSSDIPKWEDMTTEYLEKSTFEFKNNNKDNGKLWSVAVKYVVKKLSTNSTVEISDIKLTVL